MSAMRTRRAAGAALLVSIGLAASGCATPPGAAAVVDGEAISEAFLAETLADLAPVTDAAPAGVLQELIVSQVIIDVAGDAGFAASDEEGRAFLEDLATRVGAGTDIDAGPGVLLIARRGVVQDKVEAAGAITAVGTAAVEVLQGRDILVSPRYGTWDEVRLGVSSLDRPWLVAPADSAAS